MTKKKGKKEDFVVRFFQEDENAEFSDASESEPLRIQRKRFGRTQRTEIWQKTDGHCYLCKSFLPPASPWHIEHVFAFSRDPRANDVMGNLLPSCAPCNLKKGAKSLLQCMSLEGFSLATAVAENSALCVQPRVKRILYRALGMKRQFKRDMAEQEIQALAGELADANEARAQRNRLPLIEKLPDIFSGEQLAPPGGQGTVVRTVYAGQPVAVKAFRMGAREENPELLARLDHPNIIQYIGVCRSPLVGTLLVMELMDGDLRSASGQAVFCRGPRVHSTQIMGALKYLHGHNIIHRDIKTANLLYKTELVVTLVKLADFGFTREVPAAGDDEHMTAGVGTAHYRAPEVRSGQYGLSADIYSVGAVFLELRGAARDKQTAEMLADLGQFCHRERPDDRPTAAAVFDRLMNDNQEEEPERVIVKAAVDATPGSDRVFVSSLTDRRGVYHAQRLCYGAVEEISLDRAQQEGRAQCGRCAPTVPAKKLVFVTSKDGRGCYHTAKGHYNAHQSISYDEAVKQKRAQCVRGTCFQGDS